MKKSFFTKNISKMCIILILMTMLFNFQVSCFDGEFSCESMVYHCAKNYWGCTFGTDSDMLCVNPYHGDYNNPEDQEQTEDNKEEVQRPPERDSQQQDQSKSDVKLGTDKGQVDTSTGADTTGGNGGHH